MKRLLTRAAATAVLLVALLGGGWALGALVAWSTASSVVLVGLWFAAVGVGVELVTRRAGHLRAALRAAFAGTTILLLAAGAYTSLHETTVNEALVTGPPASRVAPGQVDDLLAPQP